MGTVCGEAASKGRKQRRPKPPVDIKGAVVMRMKATVAVGAMLLMLALPKTAKCG